MSAAAVAQFLSAIEVGAGIPAALYARDAVLDATVPMWRFEKHGPAAVSQELSRWFNLPGQLTEVSQAQLPTGAVVAFTEECVEPAGPWIVRQVHVLTTDADGRIAKHEAWCGGRWPAALQAEMQVDLEKARATP